MHKKKVHIKCFGCQMNKLDTALVTTALQEAGFALSGSVKEADVVLINTCSVREHAEQRVFSHLGHLKHMKKSKPDLVVGVIGCMAQRLGDELLAHEAVNIVCGPAEIPRICELIEKVVRDEQNTLAVTDKIRGKATQEQGKALEEFESAYGIEDERIPAQAFVRVMRGCNNFCSYCVVPYVRGPEISRPPKAIIEQIRKLADHGAKQVTLLGQTVNSYKYNVGERTWSLADLLEAAAGIESIEWLRFVTSYPSEQYFDEIMQVMAGSPRVCEYLHIPAQSGSDRILQAMNRNYGSRWYLELLDRAREIVPGISIAGDFIVGFPGETAEDFRATADLVEKARYKNAFIFKYSPRPGTKSDKSLQDTVPGDVKQRRNVELLAVQEKISDELSREFLGKDVKVLVEGLSKKPHLNMNEAGGNPQLIGRTSGDWIVVFNGPESLTGEFTEVRIESVSPLTLFGRLI
ncbi:MAG: tRNA (N6-isopentenyl adenosine(37)-C2)-methylthiotransferase MiaB [Planctomycetota bacterium]|jgi:tRNA-2-methylthio-N6-dimethylallyladenosine synthase